jgi:hypothetical protein
MLKAIHASEDVAVAREKAIRVIEKLRGLRLTRAAELVAEALDDRLLKARDLIASPAFIVMKAANEFSDKTTAPNQLWHLGRPRRNGWSAMT